MPQLCQVAIVLTVYGIETLFDFWRYFITYNIYSCNSTYRLRYWNRDRYLWPWILWSLQVAIVLTVYGIETSTTIGACFFLKRVVAIVLTVYGIETIPNSWQSTNTLPCCNSTYRLRYWNFGAANLSSVITTSCNSTYRLRYWNDRVFFIKRV